MDVVLNWLWQGGVVAGAWCVMLVALKRSRANLRYLVSWAALLSVAILPVLPGMFTAAAPGAPGAAPGEAMLSLPDAWWTSALVLVAAWIGWTSVHTVRFLSAIVAIRRARARSRVFPPHLESRLPNWCRVRATGRRATLVFSDSVRTAAVLGWGKPMIAVAPSLVRALDANELDRVLIHEWAHVQRRDDLLNVLQVVVRTVAGWHPALAWIERRLHVEREIACDETTVAITGSPRSYAECLMKLASLGQLRPALRTAPAVFTPSDLRARLLTIMSPHPSIPPVWSRSIAATIVSTLCLTSATVGGVKLVENSTIVLPSVSPRRITTIPGSVRHSTAVERTATVAGTALTSKTDATASHFRRVSQESSIPLPATTEQPSSAPTPEPEPAEPQVSEPGTPAASAPPTDGDAPAVAADAAAVTHTPLERADATEPPPQSPWAAAAAGGTAIGKTSKDAGVAAAGFATRFARRLAGSF